MNEEIESTIGKLSAICFKPFATEVVYYEDLHELMGRYPTLKRSGRYTPTLRYPLETTWGMDELRIYTGMEGACQLGNLHRFLDFNGCNVVNVGTFYDTAIAVGYSTSLHKEMDLPASMYPFLSSYFGVTGIKFFSSDPLPVPSTHKLMTACRRCKAGHNRCVRNALRCNLCIQSKSECIAAVEENEKRKRHFRSAQRKNIDTFCDIYQYTINLFCRNIPENLFPAKTVMALGRTLRGVGAPPNERFMDSIEFYATSIQHVRIELGVMEIISENNMNDIWGFHSEDGLYTMSPHFGMSHPTDAQGLIDTALRHPGHIFYRDMSLLDKKFVPRSRRIIIMGTVLSHECVEFLLGWRSPMD